MTTPADSPELSAFPNSTEWLHYLDRFVEQANPETVPRSIYDRLRPMAVSPDDIEALRIAAEFIFQTFAGGAQYSPAFRSPMRRLRETIEVVTGGEPIPSAASGEDD